MCSKFERNRCTITVLLLDLKLNFFGAKKKKKKKKKNKKKKNTKKIGRFLRTNISRTNSAISFKFGMRGGVYYVGHKIYEFS